jgi:hypothetical protein
MLAYTTLATVGYYVEAAYIGSVNEYLCTGETIINMKIGPHPNNIANTDNDTFSSSTFPSISSAL